MDKERLREALQRYNKEKWLEPLSSAIEDAEFYDTLLDSNETQAINNLKQDPNNIRNYLDRMGGIISKYLAWEIYNSKAKLKSLKEQISVLTGSVKEGQADLEQLRTLVEVISGADALAAYAVAFGESSNRHKIEANKAFEYYLYSIAALLATIGAVFFLSFADQGWLTSRLSEDLALNLTIASYVFKIVLVLFFFQVVQFFRKSYNAEKHLQETYQHRSDVLQSLHAVYRTINNDEEKDKLLTAAAMFAYERGETGYITTKEGAGSESSYIDILNRFRP